jgi:hypothetical protein
MTEQWKGRPAGLAQHFIQLVMSTTWSQRDISRQNEKRI